jgi:hypothetical protein
VEREREVPFLFGGSQDKRAEDGGQLAGGGLVVRRVLDVQCEEAAQSLNQVAGMDGELAQVLVHGVDLEVATLNVYSEEARSTKVTVGRAGRRRVLLGPYRMRRQTQCRGAWGSRARADTRGNA